MKITINTPVERTFNLVMSEQEARTLLCICGKITGASIGSRRKHTDDIHGLLDRLGVKPIPSSEVSTNSIHFRFSEEVL
jgi:hypothetical protein